MAGTVSTVCIIIITACCSIVTIVTLIIAFHYCSKNMSKCGKYQNYEKPLKKHKKENVVMAYSAMQPVQLVSGNMITQQVPLSTIPANVRHQQAEPFYSDIEGNRPGLSTRAAM